MIQATILAFITLAVVAVNAFTSIELTHQNEALQHHNMLRARHCVPPLKLDAGLSRIAQDYANYLAANNKFEHSQRKGIGENLYMMGSSAAVTTLKGSVATQSWYDEIKDYNFNQPGFSGKTGHFTQVVWKGSTDLGVGIGFSHDKRKVYIVANYSPAGNFMGQFPQQVTRATC